MAKINKPINDKLILGISAYYHDSAAVILDQGKIVAAVQEERFSRIKHDASFPKQAIEYCLKQADASLKDISYIVFYDKPMLKFERLLETYLANAPAGFRSFLKAMPVWLKEKLYLKSVLRREFRQLENLHKNQKIPQLLFSEHHLSHAASAFFPSPFEDASVLCLDGVGEWTTSSAWKGEGNNLSPIWEIDFPHSIGLLYSAFTYYTGFRVNSGEYKLMGLAPYGEPIYKQLIKQTLINIKGDGSFSLDMSYFNFATGLTMTNHKFNNLFGGPPRSAESEITQKEMDLARSIQEVTEEIILKIVENLYRLNPSENLCLAGGVALNCVANGKIQRQGPFKNIWIQPAAGDAGGALGAALIAWHHYQQSPREMAMGDKVDAMQGAFLGPEYSEQQISSYLNKNSIPFETLSEQQLYPEIANLLSKGNVIGWFQGRMEFGPRALGNRSILGDARNQKMQSVMNLKIKQRESFRPFAPIVLEQDVGEYFEQKTPSPYMLLVAKVNKRLRLEVDESLLGLAKLSQPRSMLPAITHVDHSARIQTVNMKTNNKLYQLLIAFKKLTQCSVLVNTSFNVRGEPPVCTPAEAMRCFLATDMDYLVMGNLLLKKVEQPEASILTAQQMEFNPD